MSQSAKVLVFKGSPALAELQLATKGLIEGRVLESVSKRPVPDITVRLWSPLWKLIGAVRTDVEGAYRFEGVDAGPQVVTVDVPATYTSDQSEHLVQGTGSRRSADFHLRRASSVSGRVVDASFGTPLAGLVVAAYDAQGHRLAEGTTGPLGEYNLAGLPEQDVTVRLES